jgi:putative oxidoreductase
MFNTSTISTGRPALGLTILRVVSGIIFLMHGAQKFFEYGIPGTIGAFGQMGVPLANVAAPLVATVELVGGLALILGILTRPAALLLAIDMLAALFLVHLPAGFFLPNGYEFVLALAAAAIALALTGPGAFALDNVLAKRNTAAQRPTETAYQTPRG